MLIEDGKGTGVKAGITLDNHMQTAARTFTLGSAEALEGHAFNFNTGSVTLTNASTANGVGYIKNTGEKDIIITTIILLLGNSTSGTGDGLFEVLHNPSTGTLISDASEAIMANRFIGSSHALTCLCYKPVTTGETIAGEDIVGIQSVLSSPVGRIVYSVGSIILAPGQSIGFRYTTQASNSSQQVMIAASLYEVTLGV